jgi:hypothetical protein
MGVARNPGVTRQAHVVCLASVSCNSTLRLPFARCSPGGDPGAPAPDRCALTLRQETAEVDHGGPCLLGVVVQSLGQLAIRAGHRRTRDRPRLAS